MNSVCQRGNNVEIGCFSYVATPNKTIVLGYTQLDPHTPRACTLERAVNQIPIYYNSNIDLKDIVTCLLLPRACMIGLKRNAKLRGCHVIIIV